MMLLSLNRFCFQFLFLNYLFDLCNLSKNSALIFHPYFLVFSETKKKWLILKKKLFSVFRPSIFIRYRYVNFLLIDISKCQSVKITLCFDNSNSMYIGKSRFTS